MSNVEVGSAYVSVYPRTDKNFNNSVGQEIGTGIGTGLSAKAVAIGNIVSNVLFKAADAVASGVSAIIGGAFENYANYEQLAGGIETLFDKTANEAMANAQEAFRTAGMSANEYMETVTGFAAALRESLGDEYAWQMASYADQAVQDMADNANKMGTSMESIQNAYQGFAKQNFTMLDNLKLGYGGTKAEMERLLRRAEELEGLELGSLSTENFADIVMAIHAVQEEMGITGTTAQEAASTISGSISMLQASWNNFLTELGKDDADLGARSQELADSIVAVIENLAPRLLAVAENIMAAIPELYEKIQPYIDEFIEKAATFVEEHQPELQAAGEKMFDGIKEALKVVAAQVLKALIESIGELIRTVPEWYPELVKASNELFLAILNGFVEGITPFFTELNNSMQGALDTVGGFFSGFFNAGGEIIGSIADGAGRAISTVEGVFEDVKNAITHPIETAKDVVSGIIDTIERLFDWMDIDIPSFDLPHIEWHWESIGGVLDIPVFDGISWWGTGGFVDNATLIGVGERGGEFIWPSYDPYFDQYAKGIAEHMPGGGGVDIHDCTFVVRKDSDIRAVAVELNTLINRQTAGGIA